MSGNTAHIFSLLFSSFAAANKAIFPFETHLRSYTIIEKNGVYSAECAMTMAEVAQKIYGTDIAVGITGTTGNVDPDNSDSVVGEAFYCIRIGKESHDFHLKEDVGSLDRREIKQLYAAKVYDSILSLL